MNTTTTHLIWTQDTLADDQGRARARVAPSHIGAAAPIQTDQSSTPTVIVRCGPHRAADTEPSPDALLNWGQNAWDSFNSSVRALIEHCERAEIEPVILPGAGGRLSDAVCTRAWARAENAPKVAVLADPVGWLTPSMLGDAEDHLIRFAEICREIPNLWGIIERSAATEHDTLVPAPLGSPDPDPRLGDAMIQRILRTIETPRRVTLG